MSKLSQILRFDCIKVEVCHPVITVQCQSGFFLPARVKSNADMKVTDLRRKPGARPPKFLFHTLSLQIFLQSVILASKLKVEMGPRGGEPFTRNP